MPFVSEKILQKHASNKRLGFVLSIISITGHFLGNYLNPIKQVQLFNYFQFFSNFVKNNETESELTLATDNLMSHKPWSVCRSGTQNTKEKKRRKLDAPDQSLQQKHLFMNPADNTLVHKKCHKTYAKHIVVVKVLLEKLHCFQHVMM